MGVAPAYHDYTREMLDILDCQTACPPWPIPNFLNIVPQVPQVPVPTLPSQPSTPSNAQSQGVQATIPTGQTFAKPMTRTSSIIESGITLVNTSKGPSASQVGPTESQVSARDNVYKRHNT